MRRILHVILDLAEATGGPPRALASLAAAQAARGDDVVVLPCIRRPGPQCLEAGRNGSLTVLPAPTDSRLLWYNRRLRRVLGEAARDRDLVHIHGTWRYHLLGASSAARQVGIPYIIRPAGNLGRVTRSHKWFLKRPYFEIFERRAIDGAAAIHACSRKEVEELEDLNLRPRTFIVPQPVGAELTAAGGDDAQWRTLLPGLDASAKIILYLGRIHRIKRIDTLLEAFIRLHADFPDWRLVLAGPEEDGLLAEELRRRIREQDVSDRVFMPGLVSGTRKTSLLRRSTLFAQPSSHENFGLSVAEALLFGLPCVVSTGVALADEVSKAGAGLACESTVDEMERGLRRLMGDAALLTQSGAAAATLAKKFTAEAVAEQLDAEYARCLGAT